MNSLIEFIRQPWPWWVSGPLIGLMVPILLILGNKPFGVSSSMKHICAMCLPANISFFNYDWKKEIWNLFFVTGILLGASITWNWLSSQQIDINPKLISELSKYGISNPNNLVPAEQLNWQNLVTLKGIMMTVVGGFLVGFGTRYADGCTSGHSIMGLSNLQGSSLVATCSFMAGGFVSANFIVPAILKL
ncbi:MAG: YeeE/YedE family protein [Chitinophagaceae bacterium]|nr:YeeE/YedE family protein [Chitinophagaceae bacterium]